MNPQRPHSATDRTQVKVWLPTELYERLRATANEQRRSMTTLVVEAIELSVRAHESWRAARDKGSVEAVLADQIDTMQKLISKMMATPE